MSGSVYDIDLQDDKHTAIYTATESASSYYKHQGAVFNVIVKIVSGSVYDLISKSTESNTGHTSQHEGIRTSPCISTEAIFSMLIVEIMSECIYKRSQKTTPISHYGN